MPAQRFHSDLTIAQYRQNARGTYNDRMTVLHQQKVPNPQGIGSTIEYVEDPERTNIPCRYATITGNESGVDVAIIAQSQGTVCWPWDIDVKPTDRLLLTAGGMTRTLGIVHCNDLESRRVEGKAYVTDSPAQTRATS